MLISKTSYNVIWGMGRFVRDGSKDISFTGPISRSPFLPSWNLHKVELFSAFISDLDDCLRWYFKLEMFMNMQVSLIWKKIKIDTKDGRIQAWPKWSSILRYTNH